MIELEVLCTGKNTRLEDGEIVTDISFQSPIFSSLTHSTGAVIGLPDTNNLQKPDKLSYNLMSGVLTVSVFDSKEADKYQVGKLFKLSVGIIKVTK